MVTKEIIPKHPFDVPFRRKVASEIRAAKKSLQIVTGEISAYDFLELRAAAEDAAERGVMIEVYAKGPDPLLIERLLSFGIHVYIGSKDPPEHCMIRDGKAVTVSYKVEGREIPTPRGQREAAWYDSHAQVKKYQKLFQSLKRSAKPQSLTGKDPLKELFA